LNRTTLIDVVCPRPTLPKASGEGIIVNGGDEMPVPVTIRVWSGYGVEHPLHFIFWSVIVTL
jgi:hypothetical protein